MNRLPPAPGTNGAAASRRSLSDFGAAAALAAWATGTATPPVRTSGAARTALIGHIDRQFTLPLGAEVEIDAAAGTIGMLAPAVR